MLEKANGAVASSDDNSKVNSCRCDQEDVVRKHLGVLRCLRRGLAKIGTGVPKLKLVQGETIKKDSNRDEAEGNRSLRRCAEIGTEEIIPV